MAAGMPEIALGTPRAGSLIGAPSPCQSAVATPRGGQRPAGSRADLGGNNIRVAVRIRPFNAREVAETNGGGAECAFDVFGKSVVTRAVDTVMAQSEYTRPGRTFNFDEVFNSVDKRSTTCATQHTIFEGIGVPILENALNAYNGCLLAYGQTGAGKSHSVLGDPTSEEEKGLLPRACERLFEMVDKQRKDAEGAGRPLQAAIFASYLEIYQEKMYDLLVSTRTDLQVRLHKDLGPHVPGLTQTPVSTIQEVQELLDFGAKNRAVGATSMNASSSRSHAVFTIDLRITITEPGGTKDLQSKVSFVDLAGSEKQKKTGATGERLQEGIAINQSLSALSRVIQALAGTAGKNAQPPFRESKLTLLLKDALSGNSRTVLLACISPSGFNFEESISTLEFASRCKLIKTNAKKNEQDKKELIESLTQEKEMIAQQLERESSHRLLLQQELEKEVMQSKFNQEQADKARQEKLEIERQLQELMQSQSSQMSKYEQEKAQELELELKKAAEELETRLKQQQEIHQKNEQLRLEEERKAQEAARELQRLKEEQEHLAAERQRKEEEMEQLRQQKELEVTKAENERVSALKSLEESARKQEEEQRLWAQKHEESARRAQELEEELRKKISADAERERLEKEHAEVKAHLEAERKEKERRMQEAEEFRQEREQLLRKVEEEQRRKEEQLEELRRRQEEERLAHEALEREKERQARELEQLREQEAAERIRRQELEEREKANAAAKQAELEKLEREKAEQLSLEAEKRKKAVAEMQEKLAEAERREEEVRRKAEETRAQQAELFSKLQEEDRKAKQREEELQMQLKGLQGLQDSWKFEKEDLEARAQAQRQNRDKLLENLGIKGLSEDNPDAPRLVNLHLDPMLQGCLVFCLPQGETRIGSDKDKCRVCVAGLDVTEEVCTVTNDSNEQLTVTALPRGLVRINGVQVPEGEGKRLANGDRLAIGRAHIFQAVIPKDPCSSEVAKKEEQFATAMRELKEKAGIDPRFQNLVDQAVMTVKRVHSTEEANDLLDQAKFASEMVAFANALLRDVPKDWADEVESYELGILFKVDGRPTVCVVARPEDRGPGGATEQQKGQERHSKGIWEASRFEKERLPYMEKAIEDLRARSNAEDPQKPQGVNTFIGSAKTPELKIKPTVEDWESYAWSEVLLDSYNELIEQLEDLRDELEREKKGKDGENKDDGFLAKWFGRHERKAPEKQAPQQEEFSLLGGLAYNLGFWAPKQAPGALPPPSTAASAVETVQDPSKQRSNSRVGKARNKGESNGSLILPRASQARSKSLAATPAMHGVVAAVALASGAGQDHPRPASRQSALAVAVQEDASMQKPIVVKMPPRTKGTHSEPADLKERAKISVPHLFEGKLGVRLRMESLTVTGFDVPKAAELGWKVGDEIEAVNGRKVRSKEEFRTSLAEARTLLPTPIVFTVVRSPNGAAAEPGAVPAAGSRARSSVSSHHPPLRASTANSVAPPVDQAGGPLVLDGPPTGTVKAMDTE